MSNLSDKELDRLSREAADFYEPDESSLSWSRLEQKLTEQMPERPPDGFRFGRVNPYLWGSAIVVVAGFSFFFIKNIIYSQHSTRTNQPVTQEAPASTADKQQGVGNNIQSDSISVSGDPVLKVIQGSVPSEQNLAGSVNTESKNKSSNANSKKTYAPDKITSEAQYAETISGTTASKIKSGSVIPGLNNSNRGMEHDQTGKKVSGSKLIVPLTATGAGTLASRNSGMEKTVSENESGESIGGTGNHSVNGRNKIPLSLPLLAVSGHGLGTVSGNDSVLFALAKQQTTVPKKTLRVNRSLNVGITFGPDYTDAGGVANNQLGNNVGLTIGYYLTSKLSINTGLIYSNKFYWSPRKGPSPQPVYYAGGPQTAFVTNFAAAAPTPVEYLNGFSNIWEIPVTLRYDFTSNGKSKFFANAGLSSYFMMKQTSIYFSHNGSTLLAWKKTNSEQMNYWFDVATISMGMETNVGKGFSFQFEPYLKLPLKNMGMENLKLNSFGILLSFRYSPALSRSKK